jgi:hypothetical protein
MMSRVPIFALAAMLLAAPAASAQGKWKDIGPTSSANMVSVDARSVKRTGNLVAATVRVVFTPPVKTTQGTWASSQTKLTVDCAKKSLAAKENAYFSDVRGTKLVSRTVNKLPGYGPALNGSMGQVALTYLCKAR